MESGHWKEALALLVVLVSLYAEASVSRRMDDFIEVVKQLEDEKGGRWSRPGIVLRRLRRAADLHDPFIHHYLGNPNASGTEVEASLAGKIRMFVHHGVSEDARENGVVLTHDGTTVALRPLLLGIEAGFRTKANGRVGGLHQLTLAGDLGRVFSVPPTPSPSRRLSSDGCWDSLTSPRTFTLSDGTSALTTAQVNGGMDGVIIGAEVSSKSQRHQKLSSLLEGYYARPLRRGGLYATSHLIGKHRRENFRNMVTPLALAREAMKAVELRGKLRGHPKIDVKRRKQLVSSVKEGLKQFVHKFMDCPPIIPRCMWGAEPYRGTPTNLTLPLSFMYIHHTHSPGQPCLTFEQCSEDMRSIQHFHQDVRGWDDIGYSFVAGSDGFIYEGRGWLWQGAHTLGHNSKGFGVSFIGDYATSLPSQHAMMLVRDRLASCAIEGGRLVPDFVLYGHRQVVNTSCPGDALFDEIKTWEHFQVKE